MNKMTWRFVGAIGGILLLLGAVGAGAQTPKGTGSAPDKSLLEPLDQLIRQIEREFLRKDGAPPDRPALQAVNCDPTEDIMARFQQLEPKYTEIRQVIEQSNKQRPILIKEWRDAGLKCNPKFKEANQSAIDSLKKLQIDSNQEDLTKVNICVESRRIKLLSSLSTPVSLPHHIEKTTKDIDALRRLGSRILEMTMDLEYFRDKRTRLVEGYQANLRGCP